MIYFTKKASGFFQWKLSLAKSVRRNQAQSGKLQKKLRIFWHLKVEIFWHLKVENFLVPQSWEFFGTSKLRMFWYLKVENCLHFKVDIRNFTKLIFDRTVFPRMLWCVCQLRRWMFYLSLSRKWVSITSSSSSGHLYHLLPLLLFLLLFLSRSLQLQQCFAPDIIQYFYRFY